jgi:hypothetical protein
MDGEQPLWSAKEQWLDRAVEILDFFHVLERLWKMARILFQPRGRGFRRTSRADDPGRKAGLRGAQLPAIDQAAEASRGAKSGDATRY